LANFYLKAGADKTGRLLQAHEFLAEGQQFVVKDPAHAISLFEQSRDLFNRLGDECSAATAETWAAQMLRDVGKIDDARERLTALAASAEKKKFLVLLPPAYYWLGMNDYSQGRVSDSAKNLKTALRLAEAGENVFEIQHAEDGLAKNYAKLGELPPALFYGGQKFSVQAVYYQRGANPYWRDKGTLAELTLQGGFPATSLSIAREMLSFAEARSFDDVRLNDSLRHVVEASLANNDLNGALRYANQSLEIVTKRGDGPETATTKAEIYRVLGDINRQGNNCNEALANYDQALELYGRLPEVSVGAYQLHKGKLSCFQKLEDGPRFNGELKVVMQLTEEYRQNIREDTSRQAFFDSQQEVFDAAIAHAIGAGDMRGAFALVEESKARSLLQFIESPKSIAEVETEFASVTRPLGLDEIQKRLPEQVQLIQYAVLPDRLGIWTISKTQVDFQQKEVSAAELEQKITDYQTLIVNQAALPDLRRRGRELFALLIPAGLSNDQQICFLPDKFLHRLAFSTLVSNEDKYLLQEHALSYAPSASILILATENARRRTTVGSESLLAVGNPDFDRGENPNLPDLRDAEAEAQNIAALYPKPNLLLGSEVTKQKFLAALGSVDVVHFAGHFLSNSQAPAHSKLLLAGSDLRSAELGATKLPKNKLVVLSACETAFEQYNRSEGSIGIARTFLALGAPLVAASQWKVESETTRDLMVAFHRHRKQGHLTSAESLRQAQLEVLSKAETRAPFFWAAFSLFGGYTDY
jgi:CHAT domain-containing protein/tetratricopeptide (TPR) repeat protein